MGHDHKKQNSFKPLDLGDLSDAEKNRIFTEAEEKEIAAEERILAHGRTARHKEKVE